MINASEVYKIRYIPISKKGAVHGYDDGRELKQYGSETEWVGGYNVIPKLGGSGKTFTSKKIVNRMFGDIQRNRSYGDEFKCEIVTFILNETSKSDSQI